MMALSAVLVLAELFVLVSFDADPQQTVSRSHLHFHQLPSVSSTQPQFWAGCTSCAEV